VQTVINSSAQTLCALRTLRAHGMDDATLQMVFRSVVIAKLTYASSAWWGFATTTDRKQLQAFIRRSHRSRFVPPSLPPLDELCRASDDKLFASISFFLPSRLHNRTITYRCTSITSNFLIKLVISQTAILCSACYFSKRTDVPSSCVIFILFHSSLILTYF